NDVCFFFSSRRRHTRSKRDWSSDVCSSDLETGKKYQAHGKEAIERARSLSDEVCKSHDLSVVKEHNASVRHTLAEQHLLEKNKISWKDELREAIEYARDNSTNFDSFK